MEKMRKLQPASFVKLQKQAQSLVQAGMATFLYDMEHQEEDEHAENSWSSSSSSSSSSVKDGDVSMAHESSRSNDATEAF